MKRNSLLVALTVIASNALAAPAENPATAQNITNVAGIREGEIFQRALPQNSASITLKLGSIPAYKYYSISFIDNRGYRQSIVSEGSYSGSPLLSFTMAPQNVFKNIRLSFYDTNNVERLRYNSPSFNVGEVFIVAGQSNAANHGHTQSTVLHANNLARMVDANNPGVWLQLSGQMPGATFWDYPRNGAPWASFADTLGSKLAYNNGFVPIGIVNVAYGGSSLEVWDPRATTDQNGKPMVLFNRLTKAADAVKRLNPNGTFSCGFRSVLWHQGESNSNRDFDTDKKGTYAEPSRKLYANQLKYVAQSFINSSGCVQPWVVAKASWLAPHWRTDANFNPATKFDAETEVREGQDYLTNRLRLNNNEPIFYNGPDTDLITGDDPAIGARSAYRSDGIHMNLLGLKMHGQLWAHYVANMIDPVNQKLLTEKDVVPEVAELYNIYTSALIRTPQEIAFDKEGMRYWTQVLTLNPALKNDIYQSFLNSDERYIRDVYQYTVGRRPTWWEVNYWVAELQAKRINRNNLADKVGFENTLTPSGKKIFRLYVNILGRRLPDILEDRAGLEYWTNVLNNNPNSENSIVNAFATSPEYRLRAAFIKAKRRQPTYAEFNMYLPQTNNSDAVLTDYIWNNVAK